MKNVNLRTVTEILKAIRKRNGQINLYQLWYKNPRRPGSSKSTTIKYLRMFVEHGLLEQKKGRLQGNFQEKLYFLTQKGRQALEHAAALSRMFEGRKAHGSSS